MREEMPSWVAFAMLAVVMFGIILAVGVSQSGRTRQEACCDCCWVACHKNAEVRSQTKETK